MGTFEFFFEINELVACAVFCEDARFFSLFKIESHTNLSKLDRFYVNNFLWDKGGFIGILPSFSFSDQAPLRLIIVLREHYKSSRFRIPNHVVLSQDCVPILYNIWNKYDYSYDALSSVHMTIIEIQQFFHCKAKQVFHALSSKIGRLHRGLRSL